MGICGNEKKEARIDINSLSFKKINNMKEKHNKCICKIIKDENPFGTGFICQIPYNNNFDIMKVLITCNHVLDNNDIKIGKKIKIIFEDEKGEKILNINSDRIIYTSSEEKFDTTIIEIQEEDNINIKEIIEIDENMYNEDINIDDIIKKFKNEDIIIIHYPLGKELSLSLNKLKNIDKSNFKIEHKCGTQQGSSGSPIFNSKNMKLIGIHTGTIKKLLYEINRGILISAPLKEFIQMEKKIKTKNLIKDDNNNDNDKDNNKNDKNNNINNISDKKINNDINSEKNNINKEKFPLNNIRGIQGPQNINPHININTNKINNNIHHDGIMMSLISGYLNQFKKNKKEEYKMDNINEKRINEEIKKYKNQIIFTIKVNYNNVNKDMMKV